MKPFRIAFVCTGNICRSAMAEMMLKHELAGRGRTDIEVESFGISDEEVGNPIDYRARAELEKNGIPVTEHSPRQLRAEDLDDIDLAVAMTSRHVAGIRRLERQAGGNVPPVRMLHQFDPGANAHEEPEAAAAADVADPWYGTADDFITTYRELARAQDGIIAAADSMGHN
ncbi:low molecular weight protein-tyrosine-phosphatase [Brevibacterium sp. Marseille-P9724]|uniref:low molecular weight protein-tyrosine-phosphatase n=1 Tax=Brevibacterium sp. Marseille-P9724 TaxID=2614125 RepID=UPI00125F512D|nr:low molecular weight protein-tyrosine-phosphatase [Brevibacterium sp. Marseille-P9724]